MFKQKIVSICKKIHAVITNKNFILSVFIIGFIAILYNFAFFVGNNAVNIPFWDQWGGVSDTILNKFNLLHILTYQHNEHRIGVGLLIMKLLASISNWNQILEIKFVSFLIISSSLLISYVKYIINKKIGILDIFIPLVILNIFQYENITSGFQITFVLPLFFLSLWIFSLEIKNTRLRYTTFTTLSLLSSFSCFHGLILPVLTIIISFIECFKFKSINKRLSFYATAANIMVIGLYFIGYTKEFQTTLSLIPSWAMIKYFSLAVSNGFFFPKNNALFTIPILLIVLTFFLLGLCKFFRNKHRDNNILMGCLFMLYSLIFISIISVGRFNVGFGSRYITFAMLLPIGLYFIISSFRYGHYLKIILVIFILSNLVLFRIADDSNGYTTGKILALDCYKTVATTDLSRCYNIFPIYPDEKFLDQRVLEGLQYKKMR
jgi:hypothetical protein